MTGRETIAYVRTLSPDARHRLATARRATPMMRCIARWPDEDPAGWAAVLERCGLCDLGTDGMTKLEARSASQKVHPEWELLWKTRPWQDDELAREIGVRATSLKLYRRTVLRKRPWIVQHVGPHQKAYQLAV